MKFTYDSKANVAHVRFLRGRQGEETGAVCGIEPLRAGEQLTAGDDTKLIVFSDVSGE
jgi:uncharacterized protein YuzE